MVLPCLNEAAALPWVLDRMPVGYHAIVVDNASTDGSAQVARAHGATVVEAAMRGFGSACHAGLLAATSAVVCFMDADASMDPGQLPRVADPVVRRDADLVLGRRVPVGRGAWPLHARAGNALLAAILRRRDIDVHDLGPMRAARREALLGLHLLDRRFGYPLEMVIRAAAEDWRLLEVPIDYRAREGKSKVTGTVRGTIRTVRDMRKVMATGSAA